MAPLIVFSLKLLEDHLLHLRDFAQGVGNILKAFRLVVTEKAYAKEVFQKSLQEVANLKGQVQHLQIAN
jgi:hypothetical protein